MKGFHNVPAGCSYVSSREELSPAELARAESLSFEYGEAYDSYLLLDEGRQYFFSAGGRGVVGFSTWGRHAYIVGGLLTPAAEKPHLLQQFLDFTRRNGLSPKFFSVLHADRELFRQHGFLIAKTGEEPIIDLREATWRGKRYEWVRRQENFCQRNHVTFSQVDISALDDERRAAYVDALQTVSAEHVQETAYGRELTLAVGQVDFEEMRRRRLFVAEQDGVPVAFVVANPAYGGGMWVVEMYRKRTEAPRGVIAFLIMQIARQLQEEGVPFLSLCQVPSLRAADCPETESALIRRTMHLWWNKAPWFYDNPRQYHFKSRFRPAYRECYVAMPPGRQLIPMTAFAVQWGIALPDLRRIPGHMWKRISKWSHNEQLADPAAEELTMLNDLGALIDAHRGFRDDVSTLAGSDDWSTDNGRDTQRLDDAAFDSQNNVSTTSRERMTSAS